MPDRLELGHAAAMLACAGAVTAARQLLLQRWPAFAQATERSNAQILSSLGPLDLVWVAALPGVSEELLFRGALIPCLYPDWCAHAPARLTFGRMRAETAPCLSMTAVTRSYHQSCKAVHTMSVLVQACRAPQLLKLG